jgi:hypothetical protein
MEWIGWFITTLGIVSLVSAGPKLVSILGVWSNPAQVRERRPRSRSLLDELASREIPAARVRIAPPLAASERRPPLAAPLRKCVLRRSFK